MISNELFKSMNRKINLTCILGVFALAGCAAPGPSVPFQSGKNLTAARTAVQSCRSPAEKGGANALTASYIGSVVGFGVVGPIVVASNRHSIRNNGAAQAADKCLAEQGYVRRDLTPAEVRVLNSKNRAARRVLLGHLIAGGSLQSFNPES